MKQKYKKEIYNIGISTLVVIAIYVGLGLFLNVISTNIYDDFPSANISISEYTQHKMIVKNSAPCTFPYITPSYLGYVTILNNVHQIQCKVNSNKGNEPCESITIDLGNIPAGESKELTFSIEPLNENFTLSMTAYLDFRLRIKVSSKTINCNLVDKKLKLYSCKKI